MKQMFYSIEFTGEIQDRKKPVLLIGNHISWWDGIWALYFNQQHLQRIFYFMMQDDQLRKNWFFQYTGGFSIQKKSKSILETINYSAELLSNSKNMVLIFPSGKIQSMYNSEFIFEKGVEKILQKVKNEVQIIFIVNLVDYFTKATPSLFSFFQEYSGANSIMDLQERYNRFYMECISFQKQKDKQ